jgi:2-keto-4-pentenoate hydratase/2-oxohepta-3-ene-1,7-dioic acid hydratase in catechol pathway
MGQLRVRKSSEKFEVKNIFCIGKNYLDHIKEFDSPHKPAEIPKTPVVFLKPTSAIMSDRVVVSVPVFNGKPISYDLQNEVELVIAIGRGGLDIDPDKANEHIFGYAVGIDFTLRDIQAEAKAKGLPWEVAKGFRSSSPVSEIVRKEDIGDPEKLDISLKINGVTKQNGNTSQMIFRISYIIHYLSSIFGLSDGDLIFTGTPAGITKLNPGDTVEAEIESIGKLNIKIG